jgi:hypothetical protein
MAPAIAGAIGYPPPHPTRNCGCAQTASISPFVTELAVLTRDYQPESRAGLSVLSPLNRDKIVSDAHTICGSGLKLDAVAGLLPQGEAPCPTNKPTRKSDRQRRIGERTETGLRSEFPDHAAQDALRGFVLFVRSGLTELGQTRQNPRTQLGSINT